MVRKSFRVTVCFDLHQVTCPGVWLCPKGKIFITVSLFKCLETTKQVRPIFPLKFHQRFVFDKIFDSVSSLGELETEMSSRNVRMELVQVFKGKLKMVTLGVFQAALTSILYPAVANGSDSGAAEVDLLFESCQPFPGIIAPKAEVSTRAVIEELRLCPKFTEGPVNPTLIASTTKCGSVKSRQRTVCHNKPSQCTCACCSSDRVIKRRPKTTGGHLSPPAQSSRCKGLPPPRPKTIEGGSESAIESEPNRQGRDYAYQLFESEGSQSPDQQYQQTIPKRRGENIFSNAASSNIQTSGGQFSDINRLKGKKHVIQEEQSRSSASQDERRSGSPLIDTPQKFNQHVVEVEVYVEPSDHNERSQVKKGVQRNVGAPDTAQTRDKYYESSASRSPTSNVQSYNSPNPESFPVLSKSCNRNVIGEKAEQNDAQKKPKSQKDSSQPEQTDLNQNVDKQKQQGASPECDRFTCVSCRHTIEKLMVPWKVYAAPTPLLEHCFCHSKLENTKTHNRSTQNPSKLSQNINQRRIVASQSVTTQTSGVCRCQEANAFSAPGRGDSGKTPRQTIQNPNSEHVPSLIPSENAAHKRSKQPRCQQQQRQSGEYRHEEKEFNPDPVLFDTSCTCLRTRAAFAVNYIKLKQRIEGRALCTNCKQYKMFGVPIDRILKEYFNKHADEKPKCYSCEQHTWN